jgi:hypothetical protein
MISGCFAFGVYGAVICYSAVGVQCIHPASVAQQYNVAACSDQGQAGALQPAATGTPSEGLDPGDSNLWMRGIMVSNPQSASLATDNR